MSPTDVQKCIEFIATGFANNERAEDIAAELGKSPAWISIFIRKHAPELRGKTKSRRYYAWQRYKSNRSPDFSNMDKGLYDICSNNTHLCNAFAVSGINTVQDLADLSSDEITGFTEYYRDGSKKFHQGIADFQISYEEAGSYILKARQHLGWVEKPKTKSKTCTYLVPSGQVCGAELLGGKTKCKECWERSIPASYRAMMSPLEYRNYLKTY